MVWFAPTPTEVQLLASWVDAWNDRTGDSAVVGPDVRVRQRNPDLRYPSFIASPIALSPSHAPTWPLIFSCHAMWPDGTEAAGIWVRAGDEALADREVSFDITAAWYDGWVIRPDEMLFTLSSPDRDT